MPQRAQTLSACKISDLVFLYEAKLLLAQSEGVVYFVTEMQKLA